MCCTRHFKFMWRSFTIAIEMAGLDGGRDMRSFASLYLFLSLLTFLLFSWTYLIIIYLVYVALWSHYSSAIQKDMNKLHWCSHPCSLFTKLSSTWELLQFIFQLGWCWILPVECSNCCISFPLSIILFHILPFKCLLKWMKQKLSMLCCIKDEEMHINEEELSDNNGSDPGQMVHSDQ